jgi:hypothetical protein
MHFPKVFVELKRRKRIENIAVFVERKIVHSASRIKNYVKYLKRGYPTEFADSTQNHHKIIGTPNQSIKLKIFPKKECLEATRRNSKITELKNLNKRNV